VFLLWCVVFVWILCVYVIFVLVHVCLYSFACLHVFVTCVYVRLCVCVFVLVCCVCMRFVCICDFCFGVCVLPTCRSNKRFTTTEN